MWMSKDRFGFELDGCNMASINFEVYVIINVQDFENRMNTFSEH